MKKHLAAMGRTDITVSSMGIHGMEKQKASETAVAVSTEKGIDITGHIARGLVADELVQSDLIFVMEPVQKEFIRVFFPRVADKTYMLGSWPDQDHKKGTIKDPTGGTVKDHVKTYDSIEQHIERILPYLIARFSRK